MTAPAVEFDRALGDPEQGGRRFSYARCAAQDDREEFPQEICRELDALGLPDYYVPVAHGGRLRDYAETLQLIRAVARRDLTVAVAHGKTFLGAVSVWVGGDPAQAAALGELVRAGAVVSWGLTERTHGSDLLAGDVTAIREGGDYRLSGEKWLINNATRGRLVCVLARTAPEAGARGFSLLLVDKYALDPAGFRTLPAVRLHGIRGTDISGIALDEVRVPATALVGDEGGGAEIVLKSLQLTRTMCAALSLGALDQAIDLGVRYATDRHNYGRPLVELPQSRRLLARSYADLLLAEALSIVASRSIHALTGELAVLSAVTKFLVPELAGRAIDRLGTLLGTRSLLVETHERGRFQKVARDHRIVGIFDGNMLINLHSLVNQFPVLVRAHRQGRINSVGLARAATVSEPVPEFERERLTLFPRAGCSVVQALPEAVAELAGIAPESLVRRAAGLRDLAAELVGRMAAHRPTAYDVPAEAFELAEQFARCVAGAAAIQVWLRNRTEFADDELWDSGLWLEACLATLAPRRPLDPAALDPEEPVDRLVPILLAQHAAGRLPSLLPQAGA